MAPKKKTAKVQPLWSAALNSALLSINASSVDSMLCFAG
jgi:hypothetical protein